MQQNHGFEPLRPDLNLLHRCLLHRLRAIGHLDGDNPEQPAAQKQRTGQRIQGFTGLVNLIVAGFYHRLFVAQSLLGNA